MAEFPNLEDIDFLETLAATMSRYALATNLPGDNSETFYLYSYCSLVGDKQSWGRAFLKLTPTRENIVLLEDYLEEHGYSHAVVLHVSEIKGE